jgi:membrane fusion protein (multidrug efflux system)
VLVQVDPTDYQVAVDSAKAALANDLATAQASQVNVPITSVNTTSNLRTAGADVRSAEAGVAAAKSQSDAAQAQLRQAEANDKRAQDDLARYAQLVSKQEISQQQYDQADSSARATAAAVDAARATVASTQQQVAQARSRLAQAQAAEDYARTGPRQVAATRSRAVAAEAMAEKSRAALQQARLNLQYTTIVAPVSGIVSKKSVEVGQNIQPGQELLSVLPLDDIWITANFKETQLGHMKAGQSVKIHVDAYGRDYDGYVENIAGGTGAIFSLLPPENATGNYVKVVQRLPVRIRLKPGQDPEHRLRLGMSVEPNVKLN